MKIMRTDEDIEIISIAKVIREEEQAQDSRQAQEQKAGKAKEKEDDGSEQTVMKIK